MSAPGAGEPPARAAPASLPGVDPAWSRRVTAMDADGIARTWHLLDNGVDSGEATLLCVHGNPTWSYLWRSVLAAAAARGRRAIAVDHLDMGFSEHTGTSRSFARRVDDLGRVTDALGLTGPVITVGHDWGGSISLGWALAHPHQVQAVVLTNTAVAQPADERLPLAIRVARAAPLLRFATQTSTAFLDTTLALAHPPLAEDVRAAYRLPYRSAARRRAIRHFVADIPVDATHESWGPLREVAEGVRRLGVPALLLWGPRDPVFSDRYLRDLRARLPQADVHRFEDAGHLVVEDADVAGTLLDWLEPAPARAPSVPLARYVPLGAALERRRADRTAAVVEPDRTVSWAQLASTVSALAKGLGAIGVRRGDRVALLVPPGADLTAALYACLRIGAVTVVADAGLGVKGLHRAMRSAAPDHIIGIPRALAAARALGWPGQHVVAGPVDRATAHAVGARWTLGDVLRLADTGELPDPPAADELAAILFTSGSTGPAKGVVYSHGQLAATRDLIAATYQVTAQTRLVAAFAPFALFGAALGAVSAVPDMDVTAPSTLTATALADAIARIDATTVFAAPAALAAVCATADDLSPERREALSRVTRVLSAGAPVGVALLEQVEHLMPDATLHTPYGMTEALPITDITLEELRDIGPGDGVCVGLPVAGVELRVDEKTGEILVRGPHVKDRYDQLWATEHLSARDPGWHRTGDVGHVDADGRLWIGGRLAHVVHTAAGAVTPVGVEQRIETLPTVRRAAVVGVGPVGTQQVVVVLEVPTSRPMLADLDLTDDVRRVAQVPVAAVLVVTSLPTDVRHNSKIERGRVAAWASRVLAGGTLSGL